MNVVIQKDPLKPKVTAAFLAFMKGLQLGGYMMGVFTKVFEFKLSKSQVMQIIRYLASPKYFHTRGAGGMMVPYRPLSWTYLRLVNKLILC